MLMNTWPAEIEQTVGPRAVRTTVARSPPALGPLHTHSFIIYHHVNPAACCFCILIAFLCLYNSNPIPNTKPITLHVAEIITPTRPPLPNPELEPLLPLPPVGVDVAVGVWAVAVGPVDGVVATGVLSPVLVLTCIGYTTTYEALLNLVSTVQLDVSMIF